MDWQGAFRARLLAASPVTALVGQKVYWVDRPQASALPGITLQTVSQSRRQHMQGFDGLTSSTVQIDVWGTSHLQVSQIVEAVVAAIVPENVANGVKLARTFIDNIRDLGERTETAFIHRTSIDLIVHHSAI